MELLQKETDGKGKFYFNHEHKEVASIYYMKRSPGILVILHTEVDKEMQGKNLGKQLVEAVADYARKQKLKIIPECTYAKAVFSRNEAAYADIWKKE